MTRSLLILLCLCVACSEEKGTLEIFINRSPLGEEEPLDTPLVSYISIRVSGGGNPAEQSVFLFTAGGTSTLPSVEVGDGRIVTVEGLSDLSGYTISRGRSLPIEIREGDQRLSLFVARVERFSLTPEYGLRQRRLSESTVLTEDGQIFLIGGAALGTVTSPEGELESFEKYDPTSGETAFYSCESPGEKTCLKHGRAGAAAVETDRGILILGGSGPDGFPAEVELLDLDNMKVSQLGDAKALRRAHATVLRLDGDSLIAGGKNSDDEVVDAVELVRSNGAIEQLKLPARRVAMAGAGSSGRGLLFGGLDEEGNVRADAFVFDISTLEFQSVQNDGIGRAFASAVPLSDGRIVILGGVDASGLPSDEVDIYSPRNNRICSVGRLLQARSHAAASLLPDGRILVAGGLTGTPPGIPTNEVEAVDVRYLETSEDCVTAAGQLVTQRLTNARFRRYAATAIQTPNRTVVVLGGLDSSGAPIKEIEIYIPQTN